VLAEREWLAGTFSVADILMADVLRLVDRFDGLAEHPACRGYVARATARPSFAKARRPDGAFCRGGLSSTDASRGDSRETTPSCWSIRLE
jgi:glutathione S-transferase